LQIGQGGAPERRQPKLLPAKPWDDFERKVFVQRTTLRTRGAVFPSTDDCGGL
jgi:hypothetical protein